MNNRLNKISILLSALGSFSIIAAQAQNPQQNLNNVQNDINSGAVNPMQAGQLQQQENAIQNQAARDMAKHNGQLTPQEQQRLAKETGKLNREANQDTRMNGTNPNWRPPYGQQPGYNPNWTPQQQQQWQQQQQLQQQQWLQNHPNAQQQTNPYRHHRPWNQNN